MSAAVAVAVGALGALAPAAAADATVTVCGSAKVTVNGQEVVNQSQCQTQTLPPSQ